MSAVRDSIKISFLNFQGIRFRKITNNRKRKLIRQLRCEIQKPKITGIVSGIIMANLCQTKVRESCALDSNSKWNCRGLKFYLKFWAFWRWISEHFPWICCFATRLSLREDSGTANSRLLCRLQLIISHLKLVFDVFHVRRYSLTRFHTKLLMRLPRLLSAFKVISSVGRTHISHQLINLNWI